MQTKNITIGAQYVIARNWEWKRPLAQHHDQYGVKRVEVVGVGAARRYMPADSWHQRTKHDGIEVRVLDNETGEALLDREGNEVTEVVRPAEVRQEWAEYVEARQAARVLAAEQKRRTADHRAATMARITDALGVESLDTEAMPWSTRSLGTVYGDGSWSREARLSMAEVAALVEAAHEAGRKAALA